MQNVIVTIARQYGISVSEIRNANDMTAVSKLYTGQILKIPVSTSSPISYRRSEDFHHAHFPNSLLIFILTFSVKNDQSNIIQTSPLLT